MTSSGQKGQILSSSLSENDLFDIYKLYTKFHTLLPVVIYVCTSIDKCTCYNLYTHI